MLYLCTMNKYYIYIHINPKTNQIFYVGKGKDNRAYIKSNRSKLWKRIVNKYGYEVDFIAKDLTEEQAFELEIYWISKIGRRDQGLGPLINFTDGGDGSSGRTPNENTLKLMSIAHKGNQHGFKKGHITWNKGEKDVYSEETLKLMSDNRKGKNCGENHHMFGTTLSEEHKKKLDRTGIKQLQEHIDKRAKANTGKTRNVTQRKTMSIAQQGNNKKYFTEEDRLEAIRLDKLR